MSIYRRYVSRAGLEHATNGTGVASILVDRQVSGRTHPIYIVVPDEDAPEPPEIDFEREYEYDGDRVVIKSPPVLDEGDGWLALARWDDPPLVSYVRIDRLTPIEPAPERMVSLSAVREAMMETTVPFSFADAVIARLEGSDGG